MRACCRPPRSKPLRHAPTTHPPRTADDENELSISKTDFADRWRWLIAKNAFVQPFAVNFGLIGAGYCVSKLLGHHRRRRQQPEDDAAAAAAAAKRD